MQIRNYPPLNHALTIVLNPRKCAIPNDLALDPIGSAESKANQIFEDSSGKTMELGSGSGSESGLMPG